ncbi:apolipoprotein D-like [Penaeus japonicus]|uniref:apolipoprotein D-like n=1 Tax=Penaeus japonicus TaxID=27405 RepID=UPI001C70BFF1|nr:apolipoprotein D-like [Penaeus japonicus]
MYVSVFLLGALIGITNSHSLEFGSCKSVSPVSNFQAKQFAGLWYVIEIFKSSSDCMTMYFKPTGNGNLRITEAKKFHLLGKLGVDRTFTSGGKFTQKKDELPGVFSVTFDWGKIASRRATVLDTDYTNFSVLVECQRIWPFRRLSVGILSRTPTLDANIIAEIKEDLRKIGYDISDFSNISHGTCNHDVDFEGSADINNGPPRLPAVY